jgi:CelD/BcsL family acetyltransferase involved in cellulose biosynthesis
VEHFMTVTYAVRDVPIGYQLGDLKLFSKKLRMHVAIDHFTEFGAYPAQQQFSLDGLPAEVQGLAIYSCPVSKPLPRVAMVGGALRFVLSRYRHYYVDLSSDFTKYLAGLSSKNRHEFARKLRRFKEHCGGELEWRVWKEPGDMAEFHRLARQVSVKTYQERLLDMGLIDGQEFVEFLVEEAQQNAVRGYLLMAHGKPVAYEMCRVKGGLVIDTYTGFDPACARFAPGIVLHYLMIESLFSEGAFKMLDFTMGEWEYKRFFATGSEDCVNMLFLKPTAGALLAVASKVGFDSVSAGIGKVLERTGVKSKLRRLMRGQSSKQASAYGNQGYA